MALTVDYTTASPWLITIPKSDLTLESGTKYKLTVDEFWALLTDYTDNEATMVFPKLYSRIPATASTPSITEIEPDYQIEFEDGSYSVNIISGNTNIRDVEVKNTVSVNTNNTTGFIDPTYIQYSTFDGGVWINTATSNTGIVYPVGTPSAPVNNLADALTIAETNGFNVFKITGALTIDAGDFSAGYKFQGFSPVTTSLTLQTLANLDNCELLDAYVSGVIDNGNILRECLTGDITSYDGFLDRCGFNGTITLGGASQTTLVDCFSNIAGGSTPYIDLGGTGSALAVRGYQGGLGIKNKTGADQVSIDLTSGQVKFDADVTNTANIYVRGNGRITDNSTGVDKIDSVGLLTGERTVRGSGYVTVTSTGSAGTTAPIGTEDFPVSNIADALVIAAANDINRIHIHDAITTAGTEDISGFTIYGESPVVSSLTITAGTTTTNATFRELNINGVFSSDGAVIERCQIGNISGFQNYIYQCFIYGTIILSGNTTAAFCAIAPTAVAQRAYFDFGSVVSTLIISDWGAGVAVFRNMVTGCFAGASGTGGRIEIDALNTGGNVVYGGSLLVNPGNLTLPDDIKNSSVSQSVWEYMLDGTFTAAEVMRLIASASAAKLSGANTTTINLRDIADTKNRVVATVDQHGNRSAVTYDVSI